MCPEQTRPNSRNHRPLPALTSAPPQLVRVLGCTQLSHRSLSQIQPTSQTCGQRQAKSGRILWQNIGQFWSKVGRKRRDVDESGQQMAKIGPRVKLDEHLARVGPSLSPTSTNVERILASFGRSRIEFGRDRRDLASIWPNWAQIGPKSQQCCQTTFDPNRTNLGRNRQKFDHSGTISFENGPTSKAFAQNVPQKCPTLGQSWPKFGRVRARLADTWS